MLSELPAQLGLKRTSQSNPQGFFNRDRSRISAYQREKEKTPKHLGPREHRKNGFLHSERPRPWAISQARAEEFFSISGAVDCLEAEGEKTGRVGNTGWRVRKCCHMFFGAPLFFGFRGNSQFSPYSPFTGNFKHHLVEMSFLPEFPLGGLRRNVSAGRSSGDISLDELQKHNTKARTDVVRLLCRSHGRAPMACHRPNLKVKNRAGEGFPVGFPFYDWQTCGRFPANGDTKDGPKFDIPPQISGCLFLGGSFPFGFASTQNGCHPKKTLRF